MFLKSKGRCKMDKIKLNEVQNRLSCYVLYRDSIERAGLKKSDTQFDEMSLRAAMFAIRRSVMRLPDSREKLLLYNHFIRGESLEACAELIGISRRSVFRLKLRALELYIKHNPDGEAVRVLS